MGDNPAKHPGVPGLGHLAEQIVDTVREPLLLLDSDLRVRGVNDSFRLHFGAEPKETIGRRIYDLGNGRWDLPALRDLLEKILPENECVKDFEVQLPFEHIDRGTVLINARRLDDLQMILLVMDDLTRPRQAEVDIESAALFPEENPFPVLRVDDRNLLLYANRAAGQLLAQWQCSVGGTVPESVQPELTAARESGMNQKLEIRCDGRDLSFMLVPIPDRGYVNLYGRDITDRKNTEQALRESEERVRRKLESVLSPQGDLGMLELADVIDPPTLQKLMDEFYAVARLPMSIIDVRGRVLVGVGWQDICTRFHRVQPESAGHCLESDTELSAGLAQGEYRLYKCRNNLWDMATPIFIGNQHLGNIFTGQFFFEDETVDRELFRAQAGKYGFDEKEYLAALDRVPRLSRDIVNRGMAFFLKLADTLSQLGYSNVKLARSLAERDRLNDSLRESELFHRQALESIPGMVFTTRPDGYCDYQNQEWVDFTGVPMSEHLGDGWNRLLHPEDRLRAFDAWRDAVEGRAPYDLEYRVRRHDGEYQWFKVRGRPIRNEAGDIVRWFGTALNIDQLVRTQEELRRTMAKAEEATRAKSDFLANMSHEIRTPMTVFLSALEHLLQIDRNPEHRNMLELADNSARRLRSLIDDILDFSRIEARQTVVRNEPFDLPACVRDAVAMFTMPAREKNLRIETDIAADVPQIVIGDSDKLGQVLTNLVGNAVKFTEKGGVRVTLRPRGDLLEFSVADTGIGVPEDKRHLLFQSFSQVDTSFHRRYGGSGLGLAISQGLAELMGGRIEMRSSQDGGSVFRFALPLKAAHVESFSPPETLPDPSPAAGPGVRILLAEDEPMIREAIVLMLARRGWITETAESGQDAVKIWQSGNFDILLMDLQMPEMDGFEATQSIRRLEGGTGRRTCIIGLTAHARREIQDDCLDAGMDRVLFKPVQMGDLYSAIDECLAD